MPGVLKETGTCKSSSSKAYRLAVTDHLDLDVFREWLVGCLRSFPDSAIASGTEIIVDGYDVVTAGDYPPESSLEAGKDGSYDVVMLTGSRMLNLLPL